VAEGYAYVADGSAGLSVVDVSEPATPVEVGSCDTPGYTWDVAIAGSYAYVADEGSGLRVVDVSDPAAPVEVGSCETPGFSHSVAVVGDYAYVADGNAGLRVVDVSDPAAPMEVGSYDTPGISHSVAVTAGYAYVADNGGLRVVDVTDPAAPAEVGFYDTPGVARGVAAAGDYAYVADGDAGGLRVVDVSDPTAPVELGFYDTPGYAEGVTAAGSYAYVADGDAGLRVASISDPAAPVEVGFYNTLDWAVSVAVAGGYTYVADADFGLLILRVSGPPTLAGLPDQIFSHGTLRLPRTIDLWDYVLDVDTPVEQLTFAISSTPPVGAGVTMSGTHSVHLAPSSDWCGYTDVTVRATEPGGRWDEDTFRVAVTWSCKGPLPVPDQFASRDESITLDLTEYEPQVGDGTGMYWYATGEDHCAVSGERSEDDVLSFTPESGFQGSDTVTLHMTYPWDEEASQPLTLTWGEDGEEAPPRIYLPLLSKRSR
jgi:hypothetical protein